jgi:hypothetical protein
MTTDRVIKHDTIRAGDLIRVEYRRRDRITMYQGVAAYRDRTWWKTPQGVLLFDIADTPTRILLLKPAPLTGTPLNEWLTDVLQR